MNRIKILFSFLKKKPVSPVFDLAKIKWYFKNNDISHAFQVLTEQTCTDLNLDDFFFRINKTFSCVGQQYMYDRLRRIPLEPEIAGSDSVLQHLKNHKELVERSQKLLSKLAHENAYYICSLFHDDHPVLSPVMRKVLKVLQLMPFLFIAVFIFFPKEIWIIFAAGFFIINMILHYRNRITLSSYLHSVPQFFKLVFIARKLSSETAFVTIRPDIKTRLQSIQRLVGFLSYFKYDDKIENDAAVLLLAVKELISIFFLIEPNVLFRSFRLLEEKRADIEVIFAYVGYIDMLQSVARMQGDIPWYCKPQWTEEGLQTTDIYHPLIEHCIPNTLNTGGKSVLLTGSNMSGKTTFIRTIALNMLSANALNMCFARSFSGRRMKIHSAINLHDNLLESQSFYMKEVMTVKDMLEKTHQSGYNLFILDEIFKGTNTLERIAASKAVLSALAVNGNMVFASTHDLELADLLAEEYDLYNFCEQIEQNQLYFDYLIKQGKLKNRNAIRLLEIEGYPESVISEAISITERIMNKEPKAIFLDIDGTLILNNEGPFDEDIEQIKIAKKYGHLFFLNTGRAFSNIPAILKEAAYIDGMIMGSGTHVQVKGETIYHKWIGEKILVSVCRYYLNNKKWCVFEGEKDLYGINNFDPDLFVGEVTSIDDESDFSNKYQEVKITKLTIEGEATMEERNFLEDYFQLNSFSNYYEGIIKGENKSNGIKMILKEIGILLENSIAIGDSINDISALKTVNLGIAMGNACNELKEIAQYITDDCKHGGVGKAIKAMVLTKGQ